MISGEELAAFAAGEADPVLVSRVESALADDPVLQARLARLREVDVLLGDLPAVHLTDAEADRLAAAVDRDLAVLVGDVDSAGAPAVDGRPNPRARRSTSDRRSWWSWAEPGRLAGVAAALVVVVGVVAIGVNGLGRGGNEDSAESADMAAGEPDETAASGATEERAETMMDLPSSADDGVAGQSTEPESSTESAAGSGPPGSAREEAVAAPYLPVVDDGRVVATVDDVDPTALRDRLGSLVDLDAIEDPTAAAAPSEGVDGADPDGAGPDGEDPSEELVVDGQVSTADHERVQACLPVPAGRVVVTEVITLAPQREVILYVLADQVVVVDAGTCGGIAELTG